MNIYREDSLHLVADNETGLVYANARSATAATAVTLGILNSYTISLPVELLHRKCEWDAYDFNKNLYQATGRTTFREFPQELVTDDLLERRKLARRRGSYIYCLEVYCRNELNRVSEYMPEQLAAFVHDELNRCDPAANVYTKSIEEYAALQDIEPAVAYQELQLKLQSSGVVRLRNYALQQKFMMSLNACQSKKELDEVITEVFEALVRRARI
jgi:hypothetical protein